MSGSDPALLEARDIDAIASRLAELLRADDPPFPRRGLVTAEEVRALLGVEREWVYDHKLELGAVRLGHPQTGPLRFEAARVLEYVRSRRLERPPPRRPQRVGDVELLPVPARP